MHPVVIRLFLLIGARSNETDLVSSISNDDWYALSYTVRVFARYTHADHKVSPKKKRKTKLQATIGSDGNNNYTNINDYEATSQ